MDGKTDRRCKYLNKLLIPHFICFTPSRWALVYTPGALGATAVFSSVYMNNHFRNKLRLGNYGRLSSYIPAVALPAIMAMVFHTQFVLPDVILSRNQCPVCVQTRAGLIQGGFSTAYPMVLVPMSAFMVGPNFSQYRTCISFLLF